jgi:hypothetical protein
MSSTQSNYRRRINAFIADPLNYDEGNKHCFFQMAKFLQIIPRKIFLEYVRSVKNQDDFVDYKLCILVRLLYFDYDPGNAEVTESLDQIRSALVDFPFWPPIFDTDKNFKNSFSFWSENHILMFLSSAHLFAQKMPDLNSRKAAQFEAATSLLETYLKVHVGDNADALFEGFYEVLAHVYINYSFAALLNLYDFSTNITIKNYSKILLDRLANQMALATSDQGVSTLTASARTFESVRTRVWGQSIGQLSLMLTGVSVDSFLPRPITGFLLTSTYEPNEELLLTIIRERFMMHQLPMNHVLADIDTIYAELDDDRTKVPFIW